MRRHRRDLDPTPAVTDPARTWHRRGEPLAVPGTAATRIWRVGSGEPVVCLHGVPASAFEYREVLAALAERGLEGISFDLPGLGFAERPTDFDYRFSSLAVWTESALDAAGIDRFHLVVHDLGGPVGFDLIGRIPDRIRSLTVLDTFVRVASFRKPWIMRPFSVPVIGWVWTGMLGTPAIYPFFRWKGVMGGARYADIRTYGRLVVGPDRGRAFREIMASFETTPDLEDRILRALGNRTFPAQVIWGRHDRALAADPHAHDAVEALGLATGIQFVEGKHFIQEDVPVEVAERIVLLVRTGSDR